MFRLWWNDVPVAREGMADRLVDGLVDIPVFWCICQSLYCWYSESCSETGRYGRCFCKTCFFIMFAKCYFIIEWCLADKILPQNAQIGTEQKDLVLGYKSNYKRIFLVQNTPPIVKDL